MILNAYESPIHELSYAVLLVSILQVFSRHGRMTIAVWELSLGQFPCLPVSIFEQR